MPKFKKNPNPSVKMHSSYKMKGSPMKRNYGIDPSSPMKWNISSTMGSDPLESENLTADKMTKKVGPSSEARVTDTGARWYEWVLPPTRMFRGYRKRYSKHGSISGNTKFSKDSSGNLKATRSTFDTKTGKQKTWA